MSDIDNKEGEIFSDVLSARAHPASADVGLEVLANGVPTWTPQQERKIVRKIDLIFLPLLTFGFLLQFLDKTAISYAALWGLQKETHLKGQDYSNLQTFFYVGYIIFEIPVTFLAQKFSIAMATAVMITSWGAILLGMIGANNYAKLVVCRVLLGAAEAGITPAFIFMTSMFYKKQEQPLRLCIWFMMNGVSAMVGGPISYAIGNIKHTALPTYVYPFLIYGVITIVFGMALFFVLPSNPTEASWLSPEEKVIAVARLASNHTGIDNKEIKKYQIYEALLDPKTWLICLFCFCACISNSGLTAFGPLITAGFGFTKFQASLLSIPGGACQVIGMVFIGIVASKFPNTRSILMTTGSLVALLGAVLVYALPTRMRVGRLLGYYLIQVYITSFVLSLNHIQANVAGRTKRSTVSVVWFLANCTGNLIGPQFYFTRQAPRYSSGFASMVACVSAMCLIPMILLWHLRRANKAKEAQLASSGHASDSEEAIARAGMSDLTDIENPHFRYVL